MKLTLSEKAIKGNKRALKKLIIQNSENIYKLAFIHTKYEYDAKEIMKNTIDYINNNFNKLSKCKDFQSYMIKITIKHINEYIENIGMIENSDTNYINKDGSIDMYKAIDILDSNSKNVIILTYFYNMSHEEVGKILNINESTVKMYIRNSLKFMEQYTKEEVDSGE